MVTHIGEDGGRIGHCISAVKDDEGVVEGVVILEDLGDLEVVLLGDIGGVDGVVEFEDLEE